MKMTGDLEPKSRISDRAFDALAIGLIFLAYFVVFAIVRREASLGQLAVSASLNLIPLIVLTAAARPLIRGWLIDARLWRQLLGHIALAALFTFFWHWMLLILIGVRDGGSLTDFTVRAFFPGPALTWQLFQGLIVYALIASFTYLRAQPELPNFVDTGGADWNENEPSLKRYFIRRGEDIQPIDVSQIISIVGADDYAEVTTGDGRHLVRTTLAKFEASLDPNQFLRIHRSRIVNINKIDRAEAAGNGRMVLHMENDERIETSRAGAKSLRQRVL
ncbi:MAG: LytTR family DNA-binding domain-containing protein [Pseudomonadota bacterium]